jgi:hypothetical protein
MPHTLVQVKEVAAPELIGPVTTPFGNWSWLLRPSRPYAARRLLVGVEHGVEAVLGGDELNR